MRYNNKGITLVSLVVTIILLIIIGSVVIFTSMDTETLDRSKEVKVSTELSDVVEKWNVRRSQLNMKGISDSDLNYDDINLATINIGESQFKEKLVNIQISDKLNKMIKIKKGQIVYIQGECTEKDIKLFEKQGIKEASEI